MLGRFFRESRLRSVERKLKSLHVRQKHLRERMEELKGDAAAKEKLAKLEAEREDLVRRVAELTHKEKELKAELQ